LNIFGFGGLFPDDMRIYSFKRVQNIPTTLDKAWDFFSSPDNLARITPSELKFDIITRHPADHVYAGELIEYKLSPLPGFRVYWMTEITHVAHGLFVGRQLERIFDYRCEKIKEIFGAW